MDRRFSPSTFPHRLSGKVRAFARGFRQTLQGAGKGGISEALIYQGLIEQTPDGIIILSLDDQILKVNAQAARLLGYSPEELVGRSIWETGVSAEPEKGRAVAKALRAGETIPTYERQFRRKDGSVITGELSVALVRDAGGKPSHIQFVLHDISARRQTETALADQNRLLQTLIDTIPDFVYVKDADSRFIINNPPHAQSMGVTPDQVVGKTDFDFFPQELALRYFADEQQIMHSGQALHSHEEPSISHDGKPIWALTSKVPLRDSSGKTIGLVGITRDITRLKEREERLVDNERFIQKIAQTIPDILYVYDFRDDRYVYANAEVIAQILGYNATELNDFHLELLPSILHPDDAPAMERWFAEFMAAGDDEVIEAEYRLKHKDGSWRWILSRDRVFARDEKGVPYRSLGVGQDITERKRAAQQLQQQNEYLMTLSEITPALVNRLEPTDLLRTVLNRAAALVDTSDAYIDLVVPGAEMLFEFASLGMFDSYSYQVKRGEGMVGIVWETGQTLVVDDYATWEHRLPNAEVAGVHASVCIPFISGREVVGVIGLSYSDPERRFDPETVELLERVTQLASIALDNARLYTAVQQELAERKRTEEALRHSEERYRAVIEDQTELIARFLPDTTITFVNDAYCRFFGKSREDLIGKSFMWHVLEEDRAHIRSYMGRLTAESTVLTAEHRVQMPNGDIRWLQWSDRAVFNAAGEAVEFQTVARDITDRREAEDALRISIEEQKQVEDALEKERTLLRTFIDALPDHVYVKDRDSRFLTANLVTAQARGFEKLEDLIGKSDFDLFPPDVAERYYAMEQGMLTTGEPILNFENPIVERDGSPAWKLISKVPLRSPEGEITGLVGITRDITELKKTQQALQAERDFVSAILSTLVTLITVQDTEGRLVGFNRACEELTGYTFAEVVGRPFWELFIVPEEMDRVGQMFKNTLNGHFPNTNVNYWLTKEGDRRLIEWSNTVLSDEHGNVTHMISTGIDITVRKELEEQSLELAVEREKVKILGNFIRDASHDFRTPLSILNTNLYLIRRTLDDPTQEHRIVEMERQVLHLTELIDQLLLMTRLDSTPDQKLTRLHLNHVVQDIRTRVQTMADRKGLQVILDLAAELPWIEADSQNLSQALNNIVANAIYFTPSGGTITLRTLAQGTCAGVEITDTGIGIAEHDLPFIFDRFYRADKARSNAEGGAGLGLSIAKKVIDLNNGSITVESTLGSGTTFRVLLPAITPSPERLLDIPGSVQSTQS